MFTGIIEELGMVLDINPQKENLEFEIRAKMTSELKVDQSVSHNGVCLTVTRKEQSNYWVTAVHETLKKSSLGSIKVGDHINLERCMKLGGRLDGHIVQGHVDQVAAVVDIIDQGGSMEFEFAYQDESVPHLMVEKGSITVDGVSLTCYDVKRGSFRIAVIPYTYAYTTFQFLKLGSKVNLEFDVIGKYVAKMQGLNLE